jgi:hypothetical protein
MEKVHAADWQLRALKRKTGRSGSGPTLKYSVEGWKLSVQF